MIGWLLYSKWISQRKVVLEESKKATNFDVTKGLADIKLEEVQKVMENEIYKSIRQYANLIYPENVGKSNLFSKNW